MMVILLVLCWMAREVGPLACERFQVRGALLQFSANRVELLRHVFIRRFPSARLLSAVLALTGNEEPAQLPTHFVA
jgi:hypothetical protein